MQPLSSRWLTVLTLVVFLLAGCDGARSQGSATTAMWSSTTTPQVTTTDPLERSADAPLIVPAPTTTEPTTTTTTAAATTVTSTTTATAAPTTTTIPAVPVMQCSWDPDQSPEDCYYWGFIKSIDTDAKTLVFDLARFESTGEEEYEYELINNNPLLRTLEVGGEVVVSSCPPAEGEWIPNECGSPVDFEHFTLDELAVWVANGYEFWGLFLVDDRITLVEQWWRP